MLHQLWFTHFNQWHSTAVRCLQVVDTWIRELLSPEVRAGQGTGPGWWERSVDVNFWWRLTEIDRLVSYVCIYYGVHTSIYMCMYVEILQRIGICVLFLLGIIEHHWNGSIHVRIHAVYIFICTYKVAVVCCCCWVIVVTVGHKIAHLGWLGLLFSMGSERSANCHGAIVPVDWNMGAITPWSLLLVRAGMVIDTATETEVL